MVPREIDHDIPGRECINIGSYRTTPPGPQLLQMQQAKYERRDGRGGGGEDGAKEGGAGANWSNKLTPAMCCCL